MSDEIVRLPPLNKRIGSCPECGKPIWDNDLLRDNSGRYKCIQCKFIWTKEEVIPF